MISGFGSEVVDVYTGGVPVEEVYAYGEKVWPVDSPIPTSGYYLKWTPTDVSGTFYVDGVSYNLEDYNGLFYMSSYTSYYFRSTGIETFETNTPRPGTVYAFESCKSLYYVDISEWEDVPPDTFKNVKSGLYYRYVNIVMDKVRWVDQSAFYNCALSIANLPLCSRIQGDGFCGCGYLSYVYLPSCEYIGAYAFENTSLRSIELPVCSFIGTGAFNYTYLSTIVLGSDSVCSLYFWNIFSGTRMRSEGSIYVPASLVSAYQADSKWSYYSSRIFPIQE